MSRTLTLDVVVEAVVHVTVLLQQRHGLSGLKVLKLYDRVGPAACHRLAKEGKDTTNINQ